MKTLLAILIFTAAMTEQPRQVLLFYTKDGLEKQKAQLAVFEKHQKDMQERDIQVTLLPESEKNASQWKKWEVDRADSFTIMLIGRDGGEKLKSKQVVPAEKLFGLIDAMPMRKSEVREKQAGDGK